MMIRSSSARGGGDMIGGSGINEWYDDWWDDDSWSSSTWHAHAGVDDQNDDQDWEETEKDLPAILPEEVLGWLLMRRSGLSSTSRLSIQASAGNSLRFYDVEQAMRQQDDELLSQERQKAPWSIAHTG